MKTIDDALRDITNPDSAPRIGFIELVSGQDSMGTEYFAYIQVDAARIVEFKSKVEACEPFDLDEFGEVLLEGKGLLPDPDAQRMMRERYGVDHGLPSALDELFNSGRI